MKILDYMFSRLTPIATYSGLSIFSDKLVKEKIISNPIDSKSWEYIMCYKFLNI